MNLSLPLAPRLGLLTSGGQEAALGGPQASRKGGLNRVHSRTLGATTVKVVSNSFDELRFWIKPRPLEPQARNAAFGDSQVFGDSGTVSAGHL